MLSLRVGFLLSFVQLISCRRDYSTLKDVCLRNIYICGRHRESITNMHALIPPEYEKMCRMHEEFIACVDAAASKYCNESMSDIARMTLDNRLSLKMFCTDKEWKERYHSSFSCINTFKKLLEQYCEDEERTRNIESICDYLEPCNAHQRVFNCIIQKIKEFCGETAAEVVRRLIIIEVHNLDVICELRRIYPDHCITDPEKIRVFRELREKLRSTKSFDYLEQSKTFSYDDFKKELIMNTIDTVEELMCLSSTEKQDSAMAKAQSVISIFKAEPPNFSNLFKRFGLQNNFNLYSDIAEIKRLRELADHEEIRFRKSSKVLKDLHLRLKNHLFRFVDVLRHEEIIIGSLTEELFEIYWTNLEFPVQSIVCDMINIASKYVFKCSIKWDLNENVLNARSVPNWEDKNSESLPKDHLPDIHREGYLVEDGFLDSNMMTDDINDAYLEGHGQSSVVPSSETLVSVESPYSTGSSTESYSESIPESNSVSQDLKTSILEDVTEVSQLREIEDAIDEKLRIVGVNMESKIDKNRSPTDESTEDYGIRNLVFTDPDMDSKENIPVSKAPKEEKLQRKPQLMALRGGTRTSTEDSFKEHIEQVIYEDSRKFAREEELDYFIQEMKKMRACDKESAKLACQEKRLVSSNMELSIEERLELLVREIKEREKNKEKYLAMEIEEKLKEREERRACKREMEKLKDEQDDEFELARKRKEIEEFLKQKEILASGRAKAGLKPTLRHEGL